MQGDVSIGTHTTGVPQPTIRVRSEALIGILLRRIAVGDKMDCHRDVAEYASS